MDKDKLLEQLATYDFSAPVTIQTIIEDSDEENYLGNEMPPKCSGTEKKTSIDSEVNLTPNSSNNHHQFVETYNPEPLQTNKIDQKKHKRKPSYSKDSQIKKKAKVNESNNIVGYIDTVQNLNQDNNIPYNTQPVFEENLGTKGDDLHNEAKKSTVDNPLKIHIQINQVEKVSMYISDLLTSVSKQLLKVLEAYNMYTSVVTNNNSEPIRKQESGQLYLRIREQCFNLSYNIVVNILLPEKDNTTFVNSFIDSTIKMSNYYKITYLSHNLVRIFYFELLEWAEKKQEITDAPYNPNTNSENCFPNNHRTLREQLCEPVKTNHNPKPGLELLKVQNQKINPANTCIFRTGSPGNELSINVGTNVLKTQRKQKNYTPENTIYKNANMTVTKWISKELPQRNIPKNNENYSLSLDSAMLTNEQTINQYNDNTKFNGLYLKIDSTSSSQQKTLFNGHQDRLCSGPAIALTEQTKIVHSNDFVSRLKVSRQSPVLNYNQQKNTTNANQNSCGITRYEQIQQYTNKPNQYLRPTQMTITTRQQESLPPKMFALHQNTKNDNYFPQLVQNSVNSNYYNLLNPKTRNSVSLSLDNNSFQAESERITPYQFQQPISAPSYENAVHWQNLIPLPSQNNLNYQNQLPESPGNIETTRSISTDSGFISPLNFNSTTPDADQSINKSWEETTAPLITHVTSLNPNVSFINDGSCQVCGKTTKKKCLGCLQYYYCDYTCQRTDWESHMAVCKNIAKQ